MTLAVPEEEQHHQAASVAYRIPEPRVLFRPLPHAWPVVALFGLYPLWWACGLGMLCFVIFAIPMLIQLSRLRPVRLPPGISLWVLFLLWILIGVTLLGINPPGTVTDTFQSRLLPYAVRLGVYLSMTILLVYVGNLTKSDLSQRHLVALMAWMFVVTVAGGMLGVLAPHFQFTSPFELLLPSGIRSNAYVHNLVHPASAQIQNVLGYSAPRPKAPFDFTNSWGNNLSLTGIWFVALVVMGGMVRRTWLRITLCIVVLSFATIAAIYSLNRGLWIGVGISLLYVVVRLVIVQRFMAVTAIAGLVFVVSVIVVVTPLGGVITSRLDHGASNQVRASLSQLTIETVKGSPIVGFGLTRNAQGSADSLAVGKSPTCPQCGNRGLGSTGQLWQLLISTGYGGTAMYFGFFLYGIFRYRRDHSVIGIAGGLGLVLAVYYALFYNATSSPLGFYVISMALLWRNDQMKEARAV